jgi:hypothetical protein
MVLSIQHRLDSTGETVNIVQIRELAAQQTPDYATIEVEIRERLLLWPVTDAERAELLYLYAVALEAQDRQQLSVVARHAGRARQLALQNDLPVLAVLAGCLAIKAGVTEGGYPQARCYQQVTGLKEEASRIRRTLPASDRRQIDFPMLDLETCVYNARENDLFAA